MPKAVYPRLEDYSAKIASHPVHSGGYRCRKVESASQDLPLVSIVTVTFNAQKTLMRALESVRVQTYPNIEHIIIDGGSTDGTLDLIRAFEDYIAYWRSEPDNGIYDAFNKGIVLSTGQFIGILNADDYYEPDQIEMAVSALRRTNAPFVHGDIIMHGWKGGDIALNGDPDYACKIRYAMPMLLQVTVLCNREVFRQCGLFCTRYRIAGDYEWFLRVTNRGFIGVHDHLIRSHMQAGGISTSNQRRAMLEAGHIIWQHGLPLRRAIRETVPRVLFPNGHQHVLPELAARLKDPKRIIRGAVTRIKARFLKEKRTSLQRPILEIFLSARQICSTISPLGLEWLYAYARGCSTYAIRSVWGPELAAIRIVLEGAGARQVATTDSAGMLVIDAAHFRTGDELHDMDQRTYLIINPTGQFLHLKIVSHLNFGGFVVAGSGTLQQATS